MDPSQERRGRGVPRLHHHLRFHPRRISAGRGFAGATRAFGRPRPRRLSGAVRRLRALARLREGRWHATRAALRLPCQRRPRRPLSAASNRASRAAPTNRAGSAGGQAGTTRPPPKSAVGRAERNEADTKGGGGRPPLGPRLVEGLVGYPPHSWWGGSRVVTSSLSSTDEERTPW
jgi:hypothetical protein